MATSWYPVSTILRVSPRRVLEEPVEEGEANFGRFCAQKVIGHRRIRVVYNRGADEIVAVSVMLRGREGGRS